MKTDELIQELGRDLRPVRRLTSPGRRTALWLALSLLYVAAAVTFAWIRRGHLGVESAAPYVLQQVALAATGVLAALAAFASVIPGMTTRARSALMVPLAVMMAALIWGTIRDIQQLGTAGIGREADWPCVVSTTLGGLALWGVAEAMLRRGAVLEPRVTTILAGIAAVSLANIEACVSRVHAFTATVIVWHGTTAALLLVGLLVFGSRVLVRQHRTC
jgi:hypothetical protein